MQRAQQPVGLKYGLLFKCSQKLKMWSSAWFVLGAAEITYYKRGSDVPKTIDLQQPISIVAADVGDTKRPHSFKLTTKAFPRTLIVAAETSEQADEWIAAIRTVASIYGPPPESPKEGVIKLNPDQKSMLECTNQICQLTGKLVSVASQSPVPGVYSKLILDNLSVSALMCSTTGRVVVYKPKIQTGSQRFTSSVVDTQALLVKYKHTFQQAKNAAGVRDKGKENNSPTTAVTSALEALIAVMERTVSTWMPSMLDSDLTKPLDEMARVEEEGDKEEKVEAGSASPYVTPFLFQDVAPPSSPAPCKKHWDLLVDECAGIISYMESIGKGAHPSLLKQPPQGTIEQAKVFLNMSKRLHEIPNSSAEVNCDLTEEQFSIMKQQLMGSVSTIDYHTANIGLMFDDAMPPQVVDIISHAYGISSAISKLSRAMRKQRTQTLVSAVENIGSFSFSLSKLITQMVDHEPSLRDPARGRLALRDEVHAIQYIALHMLGMCTTLVEGGFRTQDILAFADTAKLLALSVTNTLESVRHQLVPAKHKRGTPRKLASELRDAATGSMVFWFGLVGQNASIHLAA